MKVQWGFGGLDRHSGTVEMHEIFVAWLGIVARWRCMVHGGNGDILVL